MSSPRAGLSSSTTELAASRDGQAARAHFEERYGIRGNRAAALVEERVIGAVWGANGYTTLDQADELLAHLALTSSSRRRMIAAIEDGLLVRTLFVATRRGNPLTG